MLETTEIELVVGGDEHVAGGRRQEPVGAEELAELRDRVLHRGRRGAWRLLPPQLVDDPLSGDRTVDVQNEQREDCPLIAPAEGHGPLVNGDLERPENP